jgi:CBS domain-containing membrane protein
MAEETTLALDLDWERSGEGRRRIARVMLSDAVGFTRDGGAPTLTSACSTPSEFEHEVARLEVELAALREAGCAELEGRARAAAPAAPREPKVALPSRAKALETDLRVRDVMTRDVKTLERNDHISVADELMKVGRFRHVVVLDENRRVAGVVSQRDIFYGALAWTMGQGRSAHERILETTPVKDVMQCEVVTIGPDAELREAATLMMAQKVGCLPVLEGEDLVGILTEGDFLALLAAESSAVGRESVRRSGEGACETD